MLVREHLVGVTRSNVNMSRFSLPIDGSFGQFPLLRLRFVGSGSWWRIDGTVGGKVGDVEGGRWRRCRVNQLVQFTDGAVRQQATRIRAGKG